MHCSSSNPCSPCSTTCKSWPSDTHGKPQTTAFEGLVSFVLHSSTLYFSIKSNTFFPTVWASDFTSRSDCLKALSILPNPSSPSLPRAVPGRIWFMLSVTFLRPAKHIPPEGWKGEEVLSWLVHFLSAFSPHSTADVWHWVCLAWEGERGMNKEKSHMQGYIFLNFFFCFLLSKQSKRKVVEKNHTVTEKQKKPRITISQNGTNS